MITTALKSTRKSAILFVVLAGCIAQPARAQHARRYPDASARQTVQSFFRFHLAHGMEFTERNLRLRRRWLTAELYDLLRDEFRKEAERAKAHPDEAPFIEGDPFTDSQEYPKSFRLGTSVSSGTASVVQVAFVRAGRSPREREERTVSVTMNWGGGRWLIGNIRSAGGEDLLTLLRKPRE
jgi:hypothetical protein